MQIVVNNAVYGFGMDVLKDAIVNKNKSYDRTINNI